MAVEVTQDMLTLLGYDEKASVKDVQASFDKAEKAGADFTKWFMASRTEAASK